MKTLKQFLPLFIFLISLTSFGQQDPKRMYDPKKILDYMYSNSNLNLKPSEIEGSMYITSDFVPARFMEDGVVYSVRYNAYTDEFEIRDKDVTKYLPKISAYDIVLANTGKKYQVFKYNNKPMFFVVVSEGDNVNLLLKETVKFNKEVKAKSSYDQRKPPHFSRENDVLYIGYKNLNAELFPKKKKEILKLFGEKSTEVEKYAKKNKFSFKKTADLIEIFEFYNTL